MVIFGIATSKNHIELLVPGQIWDRIRDLSTFWSTSRYNFQNFRNRKVLGDDQELLSKGTVDLPDVYCAVCVYTYMYTPFTSFTFFTEIKLYYFKAIYSR